MVGEKRKKKNTATGVEVVNIDYTIIECTNSTKPKWVKTILANARF